MQQNFSKLLSIPTIKKQITFTFLICSIIPICIFGLFAITNARKEMLDQYSAQLETDAIRVNSTLFDVTTSVITSTFNIIDTADCRSLFNHDYTDDDASRYSYLDASLKNYGEMTASISSIHIYTDNPTIPDSDFISCLSEDLDTQDWYQSLSEGIYTTWFCSSTLDRFGHTIYELTLVQQIFLVDSPYQTYLVTKLDSNYIRNRLVTNKHLILSSIDDGNIFFSSNRSYIWKEMPFPEDFNQQIYQYSGPLSIDGSTLLTSMVTLSPYKTDNHFYVLVSDLDAYHNINRITAIYLVILLLATIVPTFLILFFSSYFSNRIQILNRAMHQASLGNYNIIEQFHGDDELAATFRDLKLTVELIHEKEARFYQAQLCEQQLINTQQQMEFKMLASQINPHFLYNTLETIRMLAISRQNRDVADAIHLLGKTLHYVLENTGTDSTTLAKELNHVITYLKIQKLRFGDRVNYDIQVPPYMDLAQLRILPLLLQPIVENAILHGLEGVTENGMIEIAIILEEPALYITIRDNGEGMDADTLENLQQSIVQEKEGNHSGSIGLRNINHRLCLMYGNAYVLAIASTKSEGTTVTLTFPLSQLMEESALADLLLRREQYLEQDIDE